MQVDTDKERLHDMHAHAQRRKQIEIIRKMRKNDTPANIPSSRSSSLRARGFGNGIVPVTPLVRPIGGSGSATCNAPFAPTTYLTIALAQSAQLQPPSGTGAALRAAEHEEVEEEEEEEEGSEAETGAAKEEEEEEEEERGAAVGCCAWASA